MNALKKSFLSYYPSLAPRVIESHGRLEIIGNHTDHNHGLCLVAGASMGITAAVAKTADNLIEIRSEGYPLFQIKAGDVKKRPYELGQSKGLVRGVMAGLLERGYRLGGFRAVCTSDIFPGAGVSSSACYESLIVEIFNLLYNEGKVSALDMAKIGQFSEREYFGKPCGLLDQIGTSFGDICFLDFEKIDEPVVQPLRWRLPLGIVLVNSGGSHAKLTPYYAAIPARMKKVANECGVEFLRDLKEGDFRSHAFPSDFPRDAIETAEHFYEENARVLKAKEAVEKNDLSAFLEAISASGDSSRDKLQNTMVPGQYEQSPQQAVDRAKKLISPGKGAARIMGGGFAGSILCFVPKEELSSFVKAMKAYYGEKAVVPVNVVPGGPKEIVL